jgi:hypothetical protein
LFGSFGRTRLHHDFDLDFAGVEKIEDQRKAIALGKRQRSNFSRCNDTCVLVGKLKNPFAKARPIA